MEQINKYVVFGCSCFVVLFFLSFAFPNAKVNFKSDQVDNLIAQVIEDDGVLSPMDPIDEQGDANPYQRMNQKLEEQQDVEPGQQMNQQLDIEQNQTPYRQGYGQFPQTPYNEMNQQPQETPGERMEDQIRQEQNRTYRSLQQDENLYYREVSPGNNDNPNYFDESHPLDNNSLQEEPLQ